MPCSLLALGFGALTLLAALPAGAAVDMNPLSSGVGWFDCNNDDHLDLLYMQPDGKIVLSIRRDG
jgi:hypothetical protein